MLKPSAAGESLREWRLRQRWTLDRVAKELGNRWKLQQISHIETGRHRPSGDLAAAIELLTEGEIPAGWWFDEALAPSTGGDEASVEVVA